MLLANNEINERIIPVKGVRAFCPLCKEIVIAVCGEINIHHWRHETLTNCDPWKESETEWHRRWKEKFPKEWREYIISKYNEKHIADIRTESGLIVEFQNSSISSGLPHKIACGHQIPYQSIAYFSKPQKVNGYYF
jgi:competence CoiA-like predicted nuclease